MPNCRALSRPFAKFCRHCRSPQPDETQPTSDRSRWSAFAEFDRPQHFQATGVRDAETRRVVEFNHQVPGCRRPNRLLSHLWFEGLLAVHQADGFAAIVHPFADLAEPSGHTAICWSKPDNIDGASNHDSDLRAYSPILTLDRRYLLFSSPRRAFGIEVSSLPGWGISGNASDFRMTEDLASAGLELAAAPVPLSSARANGAPSNSCLVGLLLRTLETSTYTWRVVNLGNGLSGNASGRDASARMQTVRECQLPIQGSPAQILSATSLAIVFATPSGHWWWPWTDAQLASAAGLRRSWTPSTADDELLLDCHVEKPGAFDWRRQHLVSIQPSRATVPGIGSVELCYSRKGRARSAPAEFYKITPSRSASDHPTPLPASGKLIPIGSDGADLLFLGNTEDKRDAQLWRRPYGENRASSLPGIVAQQITDVIGVQVRAPLMVLVCNDDAAMPLPCFRIRVLRLDSSPNFEPVEIPRLSLIADPIVCAEYLFTIEQLDGGLHLIRRRLPIS